MGWPPLVLTFKLLYGAKLNHYDHSAFQHQQSDTEEEPTGSITQRSMDQNHPLLPCKLTNFIDEWIKHP